jgi:alkanesulfonate monooxygenase SsuD/methylene tetrahydromethanopterin reductase-like flavin-dependent oxidoreductase (luciferase family)
MFPRSLRVAASLADGIISWLAGPRTLRHRIIGTVQDVASSAGRPQPRIIAGLPVAVTDDPDSERAAIAEFLAPYCALPVYRELFDGEGVAGPEELAIIGSEAEVEHRIGQLEALGVTDLYAGFMGGDETYERTIALLGHLARRGSTARTGGAAG